MKKVWKPAMPSQMNKPRQAVKQIIMSVRARSSFMRINERNELNEVENILNYSL